MSVSSSSFENNTSSIEDNKAYSNTHKTYNVFWYGKTILTTVTSNPNVVSRWISKIESFHHDHLHQLIIGLDTTAFLHTKNYKNPVATLQLCVESRCLVFQLLHAPTVPQALVDFLDNENYTFVGVGIEKDLNKLVRDYDIGSNARFVDLRSLAADVYDDNSLGKVGLQQLTDGILGRDLMKMKSLTMSKWDYRFLSRWQVKYAALDAIASFEIGFELNAHRADYYQL